MYTQVSLHQSIARIGLRHDQLMKLLLGCLLVIILVQAIVGRVL